MAMQEASASPSPQVVGNAFVEQYYHILHQSPDLVHRFYQDSSLLSRSDSNGVMKTVTTTKVCLGFASLIHFFDIIFLILCLVLYLWFIFDSLIRRNNCWIRQSTKQLFP